MDTSHCGWLTVALSMLIVAFCWYVRAVLYTVVYVVALYILLHWITYGTECRVSSSACETTFARVAYNNIEQTTVVLLRLPPAIHRL